MSQQRSANRQITGALSSTTATNPITTTTFSSSSASSNNNENESHESSDPPVSAACEQCRSRKVRCDRRLPQCSNCEKAGVMCEFPRRSKRVNPVKELVKDVSGLATRLDSLDSTMQSLLREIITPRTNDSQYSQRPSQLSKDVPITDHEANNPNDVELVFSRALDAHDGDGDNRESPGSVQVPSAFSTLRTGYTPIGNGAMLKKARGMLEALLEEWRATSPPEDSDSDMSVASGPPIAKAGLAMQSELKNKYDRVPIVDDTEAVTFQPGGESVALPPQSILETSLQLFLDEFNAFTPIFNQSLLREAIDRQYSLVDASKVDMAYSLCFNNIIVLASGLRARLTRLRKSYPMGMNEELLPAFLNNSFRAFHHLKDLIRPQHVNLQALATLSMPDQLKGSAAHGKLSPMDEERRDLYWTLFVMDKQRTCITGHPFDLHFYDYDVELVPEGASLTTAQQSRIMHIYMATLWEEIYISLYSARALRKGKAYQQSQVDRLDRMAHKWCSRNPQLFSECPMDTLSVEEKWRLELRYAFHLGQVLIHSCSASPSSKQVGLRNSQAAMRIIRELLKSAPTEASLALLCRLLRNYPLLAVHSICIRFLEDPSVDMAENLELIASVQEALGVLVDHNVPSCCLTRMEAGVAWYLDVVQIVRKIHESSPVSSDRHPRPPSAKQTKGVTPPSSSQPPPSHTRSSKPPSKRARNAPAAPHTGSADRSALSDEQNESGSESTRRKRKCNLTESSKALKPNSPQPGILAEQEMMPPLNYSLLSTNLAPETPSVIELSRFLHDVFPPMNNTPMGTSKHFNPMILPTPTSPPPVPGPDEPSFGPTAPVGNVPSFLVAETNHAPDVAELEETNFDFYLGWNDFPGLVPHEFFTCI
ncbi:hypothetical protein CNMCM8927_000590 [Aspergillus lentulus]|uniref:Zn(2)-C6 fungal-type domain-containing protein n=1 Tax=Aspergillus lentulus TaxID=293939 RepID=A0AAN5YIF6_ASPLE|nr:hypothetical protein CNMCM8927_000590 [Aspergillus lentulus]